jgi:hypothetical protein
VIYEYSIVRYVPEPTRGEQLNVGVVVTAKDDSYFGARFVGRRDVTRLRRLGFTEDFGFLQDLAEEIEAANTGAQLPINQQRITARWNAAAVASAAREWANTIQFSELRGAVEADPAHLLDSLFTRYVSVRHEKRRRARDRRWIKRKVTMSLREGLAAAAQDPDEVLHHGERVAGAHDSHVFDYALVNGEIQHLIETLSFEAGDRQLRKTQADAVAWAIDDLRQAKQSAPISVATIGSGKLLDDAQRVYESLGAAVVREDELDPWLDELPREFAASAV